MAFFATQVPTPGDSVVLSDGLQAMVASVEGDILQVEAPMSGSRRVHAASVHRTPSWREEARALDDSCFQGHVVAEDAFFGVSPLVMKSHAHSCQLV